MRTEDLLTCDVRIIMHYTTGPEARTGLGSNSLHHHHHQTDLDSEPS